MRNLLLSILLLVPSAMVAGEIAIDTSRRAQQIEGWGVSLCWWARMCGTWDDARIDEIVDWLVSPDGLNYNVFRYNIGGGDDPQNRNCELHHMGKGKGLRAEMPGFKVYADSEYDWKADSAQTKIMLKIKERRPDAIFEAFSNSAPWFMTVSGCCGGADDAAKDNLRPDCYAAFAEYLVDVCRYYRDSLGIEFRTLEPFNESHSNYWPRNGSQEGCHFDTPTQVAVVKEVYRLLQESGLRTVISASDETSTRHSLDVLSGYDEVLPLIGQWNTHTYSATNDERRELARKVAALGLRLWQSETGSGGKGIRGNLNMLKRLFDDVSYLRPAAWCDWQYVEEKGDQWCLIQGDFATQNYRKVKNYYVRQQVTRFIRQGYSMLEVDDDMTLAAVSPDESEVVVVVLNNTDDVRECRYTISKALGVADVYTTSETQNMSREHISLGRNAEGCATFDVTMPPLTVKTFVVRK